MSGMIEVAQATVTIIPTMQGAQQTITKEMTNAGGTAGTAAGRVAGKNMTASIGSTMSSAGSALTKGVTVPLAAVGVASVAAWKEVDAGLDTIIEKTGASGESLKSMGDILNNVTATIPTDFATAGAAIGAVNTRFGVTGQELETLSGQFIKFAKINKQDVSSSVDKVSKVIAAFGLDAKDAGTILDALNTVGQQTGVDVGRLAQLMSANAASFREMGMSAEEAASFLGAADMAGLETSQMVIGLRTAMKKATTDGTTLDAVIAEFSETMASNASESDKLAAAYELFGSKAGASIYNAVKNGTLDLETFTSSLGDFEGSVSATFEGTLDPMDQFTTVLNQLKTVGADLVVSVGPSLASALSTAAEVVKGMAAAWNALPEGMQEFIVKAALVAAVAGPILSAGGAAITGISKITSGLSGLSGILGGAASGLGGFASSAASAASGASAAGASFAQMGGQALLLVSAGAAVFLIAEGMKVLTDSAIAISQEGPGAAAALVLLAGVAVGMTAAIVTIGSAATVSAVGLLAMGAAVLMVSAGVSLVVLSLAVFCDQLPTIAEYGGAAADGIMQLSGSVTLLSGSAVLCAVGVTALTAANLAWSGSNLAVTASMVPLLAEFLLLDGELVIMAGSLLLVSAQMAGIAESAKSAASDMEYMVSAVSVVDQFLTTLKGTAADVISAVVSLFSEGAQTMDATGTVAMANLTNTVSVGSGAVTATLASCFAANVQAMDASSSAMTSTWSGMFNTLNAATQSQMGGIRSVIASELAEIQSLFANTQLAFNRHVVLPHFSMHGYFDAQTGSVPYVDVAWYKRAATQGARFSSPSIIGVGDAAQPELLIGENTLYEKIREASGEQGDIIIPVYIGNERIDTIVVKAAQRYSYRSGGRS